MQLDFLTLYVVILLNSASLAVVWAVIAYTYSSMTAARYWLAALVMACASGPLLFLDQEGGFLALTGLTLVSGSFATMWQGLRVFYGDQFDGTAVFAIMASTKACLLMFGFGQEAVNVIAALSQIIPVALAVTTLWHARSRSAGARVAITAALIIVLGQGSEAVTNSLRLIGAITSEQYYDYAAWFLVCAIIGASVWNLGFLLMAADRLKSNLTDLATRDDLTGLINRRGFRDRLLHCEASARRSNTSIVLMMIDLDKFKTINDRYGHAAGDAALIQIANLTGAALREDDIFARIGGDEFCVLLSNTSKDEAHQIAERLGAAISNTPLVWKGREIYISASIGMTDWRPGGSLTLSESLERADELMFGNKQRNDQRPALPREQSCPPTTHNRPDRNMAARELRRAGQLTR